jgi:hypothetical protein
MSAQRTPEPARVPGYQDPEGVSTSTSATAAANPSLAGAARAALGGPR